MAPRFADDYFIGLDVGTTAVKACAFSREGDLLSLREEAYPLLHPRPGAAVQEAARLVAAAEDCVAALMREMRGNARGVGLSCPMHGLVLYNDQQQAVTPVFTWADARAQAVMEDFPADTRAKLLRETGTPVHPMSPLVKLRWLARTHPQVLGFGSYAYGIKEVLTEAWTTRAVQDQQLASATGLYDPVAGAWSPRALGLAAGGEGPLAEKEFPLKLAPVLPPTTRLEWRPGVTQRLGLTGVPVYLGGSDGVLANLGSGLFAPGEVALTVGTSGAVRATHRQARVDPRHGLFNYRMFGDYYVIGGPTNNGGKALAYWQELLAAHLPDVGAFVDAALSVPAADSPTFVPHLYGERAPVWDAGATATLSGLRGHHDHRHLARAVLEGVTDNLVAILRQLEEAIGPARRIHASGGFTRSPEWLDLLARRAARPTVPAETTQASAYGAALIARLGSGDLALEELTGN